MNPPRSPSRMARLFSPLAVLGSTLLFVSAALAADFAPRCVRHSPQFQDYGATLAAPAQVANRGAAPAGVPTRGR